MMRLIFLVSLFLSLSHGSIAQYLPISNIGDQGEGIYSDLISVDLNNDGLNEILLFSDGNWVLWENLGAANNYRKQLRYNCDCLASYISGRAEDIDGDGLKDIVLAYIIHRDSSNGELARVYAAGPGPPPGPPPSYYAQGVIQIHRNLGNLEFAAPKRIAQNLGYLNGIDIANLDSTLELEIIANSLQADSIFEFYQVSNGCVGNYNQHQAKLIILSNHTFSDTLPSAVTLVTDSTRTIQQIALNDIDEDGKIDIVVGNLPSGKIGIYGNLGDLNFSLSDSLQLSEGRLSLMKMIDLDNDGRKDLVYSGELNSVSRHVSVALLENGHFGYPQQRIDSTNNYNTYWKIEDANQDGFKDFITQSADYKFWNFRANQQDGSFSPEVNQYCELFVSNLVPHKGDSNPLSDLIQCGYTINSGNYSTSIIYSMLNVMPGEKPDYDIVCPAEFMYPIVMMATDINQDGEVPILLGSRENPIISSIHHTVEDSMLQKQILVSNSMGLSSMTTGDWDQDGDLDLAFVTYIQSNLVLAYNDPSGQFIDTLIPNSNYDYQASVISLDFDQDGYTDLLHYRVNSSNRRFARLYRNNGIGGFLPPEEITDTVNYYSGGVKVCDWDEDGYPDLLFHTSSKLVYFRNLDGSGLAEPDTLISNCTSCNWQTIIDFNNDDLPDLYFRSGASLHIVLINQGNGSGFVADTVAALSMNPSYVVFQDLNFDQTPDLIMAFNDSLQIRGYLLGTAETGNMEVLASYDRRISMFQSADLNQDGLVDLYGRYQAAHEVFWLYGDPGTITTFSKELPENDIFIYPNPSQEQVHILSPNDSPMESIDLISLDGKIVKSLSFAATNDLQFDLPESAQGIYFVRVYTLKGIKHARLIYSGR